MFMTWLAKFKYLCKILYNFAFENKEFLYLIKKTTWNI